MRDALSLLPDKLIIEPQSKALSERWDANSGVHSEPGIIFAASMGLVQDGIKCAAMIFSIWMIQLVKVPIVAI